MSLARPSGVARIRPSAATNSVHITSGFPYFAIIRRKAASVTSAIGATTKNGAGSFSQKFIGTLYY